MSSKSNYIPLSLRVCLDGVIINFRGFIILNYSNDYILIILISKYVCYNRLMKNFSANIFELIL
jgi:hypothetical protein